MLALINGGVEIDLQAVQEAKKNGIEQISMLQRAIEIGWYQLEDLPKFNISVPMSREEWDQLERIIQEEQEKREQRGGPAGEYDDMPALEDVPAEELEDANVENKEQE